MKTKILLTLLIAFSFVAKSQNDLPNIIFGMYTPEQTKKYYPDAETKLAPKITNSVSYFGLGSISQSSNFVIVPYLVFEKDDVLDLNGNPMTITYSNLIINFTELFSGIVFSTFSTKLKGNGSTKNDAIRNSINQLNLNNPTFQNSIQNARSKIGDYYVENCDKIITNAVTLSKNGDFIQSISILNSIPMECTDCYNKSKEVLKSVYKTYSDKTCTKKLNEANSKLAINDFDGAFNSLSEIDPLSSCQPKVMDIINKLESKLTKEKAQEREEYLKALSNEQELEKLRINSIKEICVSYYNRKQPNISNTYIIR